MAGARPAMTRRPYSPLQMKTPERNIAPAFSSQKVRLLRRVEAGDRLGLEIFFKAELTPLAAVARLLVAAERRGAVVRHALEIDVAGADPAADPARAFHGVGRDVTGETIGRVV